MQALDQTKKPHWILDYNRLNYLLNNRLINDITNSTRKM